MHATLRLIIALAAMGALVNGTLLTFGTGPAWLAAGACGLFVAIDSRPSTRR